MKHNSYSKQDNLIDELSEIAFDTAVKLVKLADYMELDRDGVVEHFAELFQGMARTSTFKNLVVEAHNDI